MVAKDPQMKHVMQHDLPPETARKVAQHAFDSYRARYSNYSPTLTWVSDDKAQASFQAKGITLKGAIELQPNSISFDLEVPFILKMFKKKAVSVMDRELRHWLDKAKAGEI
jgi:hypothetical protein